MAKASIDTAGDLDNFATKIKPNPLIVLYTFGFCGEIL